MQGTQKLQIIDETKFKEFNENRNNNKNRKIKSAFYKKAHLKEFNLIDFYKEKKIKFKGGGIQKKFKKKILINKGGNADLRRKNKKISILKKKILKTRARRNLIKYSNNNLNDDDENTLKTTTNNGELLFRNIQNSPLPLEYSNDKDKDDLNDYEEHWEDYVHDNADNDDINKLVKAATNLTIDTKKLHSRRFRSYCNNTTNSALEDNAKKLIIDLQRFQKRAVIKNAVRAHANRRYVLGFREVQNMLHINKVKLVIIATDCEDCPQPGGINNIINSIKTHCANKCLPVAFVLQRRQLARCLEVKGQVCCLALLDVSGADDHFQNLLATLECAKHQYAALSK